MKTILTGLLLLSLTCYIHAQKGGSNLIQAEKNFAAYSVAHNTKDAFLQFLDSAGVIFDKGNPVNGIQAWNQREKRPGVLNWHPANAGISSSLDFGYTTGPWTFQPALADSVIARGHYCTVWHLDQLGQWKFLVDLGVNNTPVITDSNYQIDEMPEKKMMAGTSQSLLNAENEFIAGTQSVQSNNGLSREASYQKALSKNSTSILNRNGQSPAISPDSILSTVKRMPATIQYKVMGSGISSAGDMGYVLGSTSIDGKLENYLRIWRKEGEDWKLAVEVLRF